MHLRVARVLPFCVVLWHCCNGQSIPEDLQKYDIPHSNTTGGEILTNKTIDQIIMEAMGGLKAMKLPGIIGMLQGLTCIERQEYYQCYGDLNLKTINGGILMELDMLLTKQQYYSLYEQPNSTLIRNKRKAIRTLSRRWTNREIPYRFYPGHFDQRDQYNIRQAMTEWERYTCLRFRESTSSDTNVIVFRDAGGCYSELGMAGGEQMVSLSSNGCRNKQTYLHEIGHVIGLVHEHQLPNRDDYVEIIFDNVNPSYRNQFFKYSSQAVDQMNLPYDYSSIMHYGATAFSKDGVSKTIRVKYTGNEAIIGKVKELSPSDVEIVNKMYKCSASCTNKHHDNTQCDTWAKAGQCYENTWVIQNCARSCGRCSGREMTTTPRPSTKLTTQKSIGECKNLLSDTRSCDAWAKAGYCKTNNHVTINCAKSCGSCSGQSPLTSSNVRLANAFVKTKSETSIINKENEQARADDPNGGCRDEKDTCVTWARYRFCNNKSDQTLRVCAKTCNFCDQRQDYYYDNALL